MRIDAVLVFGEENRSVEFPYVMIKSAGPDKLSVCADSARGLGRQGRYLHGVLECAGSLFRQTAQQRTVYVRQFDESHSRGETVDLFDDENKEVCEGEYDSIDGERSDDMPVERGKCSLCNQTGDNICHHISHEGIKGCQKKLRAFLKSLYGESRCQAGGQFH